MLRRAISASSPLYIVMLGLISALPPFGIDIGLPALPALQRDLQVGIAEGALTLTLFLAGFTLGPLVSGPLSDHFGRKPILLFGIILYAMTALACAFTADIHGLLVLRTLQGIGAGAAAGLPAAIVRDCFQGREAISRQSYVALVNGVAPLIAPSLGAAVLVFGDWRSIYQLLAAIGLLVLLTVAIGYRETAPRKGRDTGSDDLLKKALGNYRQVLGNREYLIQAGLLALSFGGMFAYISSSAEVFMHRLGASPTGYGLLFALTALGTMAGAAFNGRFGWRIGMPRLLRRAAWGSLLAAGLLLLVVLCQGRSMAIYAALVVSSNFCAGILMPIATHQALQHLHQVAGSAAALLRSLQMAVGACSAALVGALGHHDPMLAMASVMCLFAAMNLMLLFINRRLDGGRSGRAMP